MNVMIWARRLRDVGVRPESPATTVKHVRAANATGVFGAVILSVWALANAANGHLGVAAENLIVAGVFAAVLALNGAQRSFAATLLANGAVLAQLAWSVWLFGAASGSPAFFAGALVLGYLTFSRADRGFAHGFAVLNGLFWTLSVALSERLPPQVVLMPTATQEILNTAVATLVVTSLTALFARAVDATEDSLVAAEARVDELLHNVLPAPIVARLKADPAAAIADRHDTLTVLFADIVGFTQLSSRLPPDELVQLLNGVFVAFDAICEEEGALRIKTMGDGYMAICGAPSPRPDHALVMVRVATRMRDYMASDAVDAGLQVRIGLNTGPAIAGIIGVRRFAYDLWGDTVNVASRMESSGEAGRIQISEAMWLAVGDAVACTARGMIEIKGKGPMAVWFVD